MKQWSGSSPWFSGCPQDWLTRYGYLPPPDPYSAQQQTLDGLREAVKTMQRFAGLRQTGILDDDTIAMMHKPRCSLPDIILASGYQRHRRKRYAVSGSVWQKSHLTWRVDSFPVSLSQETTRQLIGSALYTWSRESNLDFEEARAGDADIRVSFVEGSHGDGYPFDGPGGTLGHAFFPGVGSSAGATHMDADESWTYNVDEGTDLFAVAVHEFGHSLGLSHSSAENSIMKPYYQGTVGEHQRYRLPPDDVQGIQALYGKRSAHPGADAPPAPTQRYIPPRGPTYRPRLPFPDRCSTHFDAVANIRGEVFFFKSRYFWRVQATRQLVSLNPAHLGNFWLGLPPDLTRVDAVYERANDSKIVFIAGANYWVFKDTLVEPGYPRPLTDFGLNTDGVDGAFVWKHNKKTYFFRHNRYWRFDERQGRMDPGYPRDSNLWLGLPSDVDDVISWTDGHTYFFKGPQYWKFQDGKVEADPGYPHSIALNWMYCAAAAPPEPTQEPEGRGQRDCNCQCTAGSGSAPPAAGLRVALALTLLAGTL
ncbi:matrix metalloproteinase-17-like [Bufo gargarizans]|uniref:matrix metalloproteinase-17-like n=1 Tax=Bufo gargarizans TaxID=30331 RepID=UPI001CF4817C|nr:matrix metalloproteinase-17-like [Bufo gargarizans]